MRYSDDHGVLPKHRNFVDFVVRSDSESKAGGDTVQVEEYRKYLVRSGYDVRVLSFHLAMTFRDSAVVHIVNVDRPFDFLVAMKSAAGHRIIVSPIHHSLVHVRRMRLGESGFGLRSVLGKILGENKREWLAFGARSIISAGSFVARIHASVQFFQATPMVRNVWRRVGTALDSADAVLLLAQGEGINLSVDTGWQGLNSVLIPNGRPTPESSEISARSLPWALRDISILMVGRIEPRKRQLDVARVARRLGISVTVVGPLRMLESKFAKDFLGEVETNEHLNWLGEMSHDEVLLTMGRSKVLLNASWVEVQSLVDLEAAFSGNFVVANDGGNSLEWLPEHVCIVPGGDIADMLRLGQALVVGGGTGPGLPNYSWTWEGVSDKIRQVY